MTIFGTDYGKAMNRMADCAGMVFGIGISLFLEDSIASIVVSHNNMFVPL
jgi:hypothetical protein